MGGVILCRLCRTQIDEGERCPDEKACAKRVKRNLREQLSTMATKPYVGGFDPVKEYNRQMGRE